MFEYFQKEKVIIVLPNPGNYQQETIFNNCMEEVSLQTTSHNEVDITKSKHYGFIDIGNGPCTYLMPPETR